MTIRILVAAATMLFSSQSVAWQAQCVYSGKTLEVEWPQSPFEVATDGNHELQFRFVGDEDMQFGEVTGWLNRCSSESCLGSDVHTFELNTFGEHGLLYCYPKR